MRVVIRVGHDSAEPIEIEFLDEVSRFYLKKNFKADFGAAVAKIHILVSFCDFGNTLYQF